MTTTIENWPKLTNAIRRRLIGEHRTSEDDLQDALAFCWLETERETPVGLAVVRAASRVNRGQRVAYEPLGERGRWEYDVSTVRRGSDYTEEGSDGMVYRSVGGILPLSTDDYTGKPGLISRHEYRLDGYTEQEIDEILSAA